MKYRLKKDRFDLPAGTIVYPLRFYDYGLASDDTRHTGIGHISVTTDAGGGYPSVTVASDDLEEIGDEPVIASMTGFSLPQSWEAMPYGEHWSFAYATEHGEREDYDFRVEFDESVSEAEERAVIALLEAAPKLLAALRIVVAMEYDRDPESRNFDDERLEHFASLIREAEGRAL